MYNRFGKFGIETRVDRAMDNRSLVSDSWSTDVYASDSEPPETQYEIGEPPLIPVSLSAGHQVSGLISIISSSSIYIISSSSIYIISSSNISHFC